MFNNRILGNVTGAIVNVDEYKVHETHDGRVDKTRSDMYLHFVDHRDNSIMEVSHVLRIIDENIEHLDSLFKVIKSIYMYNLNMLYMSHKKIILLNYDLLLGVQRT